MWRTRICEQRYELNVCACVCLWREIYTQMRRIFSVCVWLSVLSIWCSLSMVCMYLSGDSHFVFLSVFSVFFWLFVWLWLSVLRPFKSFQLVEILYHLTPDAQQHRSRSLSGSHSLLSFCEYDPLALSYMIPGLMRLYVDVENTGSHTQFFDKFSIRYHSAIVLRVRNIEKERKSDSARERERVREWERREKETKW